MRIKQKSKMMLIRFNSKSKIEDLRKGKAYFKKIRKYTELKDGIIGDECEDAFVSNVYVTEHGCPCRLRIMNDYDGTYALCMFFVINHGKELSFDEKERLMKFGDTALIITDVCEFIERIKQAAEKNHYEFMHDTAVYYDENEPQSLDVAKKMSERIENISLLKRETYAYQKEYRLLIIDKTNEADGIPLDIGNINDISEQISTRQLLDEGIEFE